jgi:hypothetical protein
MCTKKMLIHSGIIEIIILILIIVIYYSKKIPTEHLAICLLGSYISIKAMSYFAHSLLH